MLYKVFVVRTANEQYVARIAGDLDKPDAGIIKLGLNTFFAQEHLPYVAQYDEMDE